LMTTAAPKISVISAKIQKRNGDIGEGFRVQVSVKEKRCPCHF